MVETATVDLSMLGRNNIKKTPALEDAIERAKAAGNINIHDVTHTQAHTRYLRAPSDHHTHVTYSTKHCIGSDYFTLTKSCGLTDVCRCWSCQKRAGQSRRSMQKRCGNWRL